MLGIKNIKLSDLILLTYYWWKKYPAGMYKTRRKEWPNKLPTSTGESTGLRNHQQHQQDQWWCFQKYWYPQIIPFVHRVFHYFHHPFWVPLFLVQHPCCYQWWFLPSGMVEIGQQCNSLETSHPIGFELTKPKKKKKNFSNHWILFLSFLVRTTKPSILINIHFLVDNQRDWSHTKYRGKLSPFKKNIALKQVQMKWSAKPVSFSYWMKIQDHATPQIITLIW